VRTQVVVLFILSTNPNQSTSAGAEDERRNNLNEFMATILCREFERKARVILR